MSPRERAEALGWVRETLTCWPEIGRWLVRGRVVAYQWGGWSGSWTLTAIRCNHPTEDEALAHALLLLDVWLS